MAKYKRTIRFQYYQIRCKSANDIGKSSKIFNFAKWIKNMEDNNLIQVAVEFRDAKARIEFVTYSKTNETWGIRIMKLRDTNIPSKAKDKEEAKLIELGDGEYLGEDMFMIFQPKSGVAMIQQNRMSLGISRLEEFLEDTYNRFVPEEEKICVDIEGILDETGQKRISKSDYKFLELGFANINSFVEDDNRVALRDMILPIKRMSGVTGSIKISLGRSGLDTLNKKAVTELIREVGMASNRRYIRTAKLKIKEEDDTDVELLDLFNDICSEAIEFTIDSKVGLIFTTVISAMNEKYLKRKLELQKLVGYKE